MSKTPQPECPECEKLSAVADESNKIGDFIDWLDENYVICEKDDSWEYTPISRNWNRLLAQYFEIDLKKVEQERRAVLKWLREQHNEN